MEPDYMNTDGKKDKSKAKSKNGHNIVDDDDDSAVFMDFSEVSRLRDGPKAFDNEFYGETIVNSVSPVRKPDKKVEDADGMYVAVADKDSGEQHDDDVDYLELCGSPATSHVVIQNKGLMDSFSINKGRFMSKKRIPAKSRRTLSSEGLGPTVERAKVLYSYKAENSDELTIEEGQTIGILDKNLVDSGWWKGEINGRVGVFPDNFVELLPEEPKPKRPTVPPASASTKTSTKTPPAANKPAPAKHKNTPEPQAKTTGNKAPKPAAAAATPMTRKPTVPPPLGKKPANKPQTDDQKAKLKSDKDLDVVEVTERLNHPTANRAKAPARRPPSQAPAKELPGEENNIAIDDPAPVDPPEIQTPRGRGGGGIPRRGPPPPPPKLVEEPEKEAEEEEEEDDDDEHEASMSLSLEVVDASLEEINPEIDTPRGMPKHGTALRRRHVKLPPLKLHGRDDDSSTDSSDDEAEDDHEEEEEKEPPARQARPPPPVLNDTAHATENGRSSTPPVTTAVEAVAATGEIEALRGELAELRTSTVSKYAYDELQAEMNQLRENMEKWQTKHSKLLNDLMEEVDEEKKIRLATEVEMKRIKKMVQQ